MASLQENNAQITRKYSRSMGKQVLLGICANLTNLAPSMSLGYSAIALPALNLSKSEASWFASTASLATPLGCILAGQMCDKFGRKTVMFVVSVLGVLGWSTIASAVLSENYRFLFLILGRLMTGLTTGLTGVAVTVYMAEISVPKMRGMFCTWTSVTFVIGVLVVYCLGLVFPQNWALVALITAGFCLISAIFTQFYLVESPQWLIGKNRLQEAKINMCKVHSTKECTAEVLHEIESLLIVDSTPEKVETKSLWQRFQAELRQYSRVECLKPLFLMTIFVIFQQTSGTFVILFYAIDIVQLALIKIDAYTAITLIGLIRLAGAVLSSYLSLRNWGRRLLSLISGIVMTLSMISLGILVFFDGNFPALSAILLALFFFGNVLGFLPMPFAMLAEVFPREIRGSAAGLVSGFGYFSGFIAVKIYPDLISTFHGFGVFFMHGIIALLGTFFVWILLPETKGKTLREIEQMFAANRQ